uniref:Pentatricopeptide repeat-containing protein At3g61520, mitochondrial n=1 Tax=Anthurium amnicola TaxID=1678845 RepID=A0A1D1XZY5_9ARAE
MSAAPVCYQPSIASVMRRVPCLCYRLPTASPTRISSRRPLCAAIGTKTTADTSAVVSLLLRPAEGCEQQRDEELRALLASAPYTPSHLLQVIRSLPSLDAALRFFDWCRGQDSSSLPSASALHGPSAYQAMFELAARQEAPPPPCARMRGLLDRSTEQGYALTLDSAALLARAFGGAGMLAEMLRVIRGLKPSLRRTTVCNGVLRVLFGSSDSRYRREAVVLGREMMSNPHPRCRPDSATGSIVFSALSTRKQGMDDDTVALVIEMAERGLFPLDDVQFSQLINKLCWSRYTDGAWNFLHAVKKAGGVVGAPPCNSLLAALAREGDFQRMNTLFAEMEHMGTRHNVVTFGILINNLCKSRRIDGALQVLDGMLEGSSKSVVVPDVVIFNTVIDGLCKVGRLEEGLALLDRMKKELVCAPNVVTYNCLIDGLCKAGEIDRAHELLAQMNDEEILPNVVTLNTFIDGMCRHGRVSSALQFFHKLRLDADVDVKGNAVTYSTLIGAFLHANNVSKARELFEEMLSGGHNPDAITYFTMISGLSQAGKLDEAYSVALKMEKDGFSLDTKSYNILIAGFCKKKRLDRAHDLLDEMVRNGLEPDDVTFNTLIATFSKVKDFTSAQLLKREMIAKGHKPSVVTYGALIHGYCRADDMNAAMNVFRAMDATGLQPNTVIYNILIDSLSKKGEPVAALSLMDEMQDRGLLPTTATFNALLRSLRESNMLNEAFKLMDQMKEQKLSPDYVTMEILTEWLPAVGEVFKLKAFIQENDSST